MEIILQLVFYKERYIGAERSEDACAGIRKQSRLLRAGPAGVDHRAGPATFATWLAPHLRRPGFGGQDLFDFFPQPAVCRIILHTLVPVQVGFEAGRLEREGMHLVHQTRV